MQFGVTTEIKAMTLPEGVLFIVPTNMKLQKTRGNKLNFSEKKGKIRYQKALNGGKAELILIINGFE